MIANRSLAFFLFIGFASPLLAVETPPNVLIFLMDDMGYGDVHALNPDGAGFETPNLDALVEHGVTFVHAHSSASVCAPTRYALLTGNHVYRGRNSNGTWSHFQGSQILPGQQTIADLLRKAGYTTAFFGKSHLGSTYLQPDGTPANNFDEADLAQPFQDGPRDHGFDYSLTLPAGIQSEPYAFFQNDRLTRWDNDRRDWQAFASDMEARRHFRREKRGGKHSAYAMDNWNTETVGPLLVRDALRFMERHVSEQGKDRPFFIHYCSQAGHSPYVPPIAFNVNDPLNTTDLHATGAVAIAGQTINKRTDMILEGDVALGLFIKKLRELGILANTLILFTSDNGAAVGPSSTWSNPIYHDVKDGKPYGGVRMEVSDQSPQHIHHNAQGVALDGSPLRGEKGFVYEGGHRIPLIVRWDNGIPSNQTIRDQLIGLHDVYATIAAIAGATLESGQAHDSYDFSKIWRTPSSHHSLVRTSLYIQSNRPWEQNNKKIFNTWAAYMAKRTEDSMDVWKAVLEYNTRQPDGKAKARAVELFHLTTDPSEARSLSTDSRLTEIEHQFRLDTKQPRTAPR